MRNPASSAPSSFFILALPVGISAGFVAFAFPFILTQAGFSVAATGFIVAIGSAANLFRFAWGPAVDFTLAPRSWYLIGLLTTTGALLSIAFIPLQPGRVELLVFVVFMSQVANTLVTLPLGGLMAHAVKQEQKGRAAGFYQAGNLAGASCGATGGVWLAAHCSKTTTLGAISAAILFFAFAAFLIPNVRPVVEETLRHQIKFLGQDLSALFRYPLTILIVALVCSPIGAGAMSYLWGAVWRDWQTTQNAVALTGGLSGLLAAAGCIVGGLAADRIGVWRAYFASGISSAIVAVLIAISPRTAQVFLTGVLAYSLSYGFCNSAFSALILSAIGRGAASTKYALLSSLGNLPVAYMIALDAWVHDHFGVSRMLYFDSLAGLIFVVAGLLIFHRLRLEPDAVLSIERKIAR